MKKYFASVLILLFTQQVSATTFYEQLCAFNYNWLKYSERAPEGEAIDFSSDKEYIQAHLKSVLKILRTNPTEDLDNEQLKSRKQMIRLLDGYRKAGEFPINYYRVDRIPVFIDRNNTHCAVGYLLQQTGYEHVARRISTADNYVWVKDIHDPAVPVWQKASGLTIEELKLIQGAYDFYMEDAFILPNKYEIPQKPDCITAYFEDPTGLKMEKKPENLWCKGEGKDGVLNGRWEQNNAVGIPWIVGYYNNGDRTGQWKEYYKGTHQLCRTENWRNDKLNGVRKRFDRTGLLIEEILFKDGNAVTKTNYSFKDSLKWVRTPLDSSLVWTEVYTFGGALLANGHEKVHNPGNLLWFQNIELTALNTVAITSRDISLGNGSSWNGTGLSGSGFNGGLRSPRLFSSPPLVQYNKEGEWKYFKEYSADKSGSRLTDSYLELIGEDFNHFGNALIESLQLFENVHVAAGYDSIRIIYTENNVRHFYGYGLMDYTHLEVEYYTAEEVALFSPVGVNYAWNGIDFTPKPIVKRLGRYNKDEMKVGEWKYFNEQSALYKTENYIIPRKEEEIQIVGMN